MGGVDGLEQGGGARAGWWSSSRVVELEQGDRTWWGDPGGGTQSQGGVRRVSWCVKVGAGSGGHPRTEMTWPGRPRLQWGEKGRLAERQPGAECRHPKPTQGGERQAAERRSWLHMEAGK